MARLNDTLSILREPPKPRSFSKAYWDATREKRLIVQYDKRSGKYQFFPRATSIYDGHRNFDWREVSGKGEIFSYTIAYRARPPFQGHEPFVIGLVTLDERVERDGQYRSLRPRWAENRSSRQAVLGAALQRHAPTDVRTGLEHDRDEFKKAEQTRRSGRPA